MSLIPTWYSCLLVTWHSSSLVLFLCRDWRKKILINTWHCDMNTQRSALLQGKCYVPQPSDAKLLHKASYGMKQAGKAGDITMKMVTQGLVNRSILWECCIIWLYLSNNSPGTTSIVFMLDLMEKWMCKLFQCKRSLRAACLSNIRLQWLKQWRLSHTHTYSLQ